MQGAVIGAVKKVDLKDRDESEFVDAVEDISAPSA